MIIKLRIKLKDLINHLFLDLIILMDKINNFFPKQPIHNIQIFLYLIIIQMDQEFKLSINSSNQIKINSVQIFLYLPTHNNNLNNLNKINSLNKLNNKEIFNLNLNLN